MLGTILVTEIICLLYCFIDTSAEDEHFSDIDTVEENSDDDIGDGGDGDDDDGDDEPVESDDYENEGSSDGGEDSDGSNIFDGYKHKKSLEKLRDTDPEFYKYLEQNDRKLLQFSVSDSEDEAEVEEEDRIHKPSNELEVS